MKIIIIIGLMSLYTTSLIPFDAKADAIKNTYPEKPVRLVVGFVAGGGTDAIMRTIGKNLTENFKQPFVIDNRSGSAGIAAAVIVSKAPADGYTLFAGSVSTLAVNVSSHARLPYDPRNDFDPVTVVVSSPYALVLNPSIGANSVQEFISLAKSQPKKMNFSSSGLGGSNHLSQELFKYMAGIDVVHIPYKGAAEQLTSILSGEVQMSFIQIQVVMPQMRAKKLKTLAISSAERLTILPDLPTLSESGVEGYDVTSWQGIVVPKKTPKPIIDLLHSSISKALKTHEIQDRIINEGSTPGGMEPIAFQNYINHEIKKWEKVFKFSGIKKEAF